MIFPPIVAGIAAFGASMPSLVQPPRSGSADAIVIVANRTGIPVWRMRGEDGATLVLVGTIRDIAKGTQWDGGALDSAIAQADRVMFPQMVQVSASPLAMIGWLAKWRSRQKLPNGHSLSAMLSPDDRARVARLAATGQLPRDWDRYHPLHLAFKLQDGLRQRTGMAKSADSFVQSAIRKHKVALVPTAKVKAQPLADDVFKSTPQSHAPCLSATLALVEAGPAELRRRSNAWAARRVPQAIRSPAEAVDDRCWPSGRGGATSSMSFVRTAEQLLRGRETVIAVVTLGPLAEPGGVLDQLERSGADISGPAWK